jgi:hypothetical protein
MWNNIPARVRSQFLTLGAVKYSYIKEPYTVSELVYVWDADQNEIGYVCTLFPDNPQIFAPKFREWSAESLAAQHFEEIPRMDNPVYRQNWWNSDDDYPAEATAFTYEWLHLPTGKTDKSSVFCLSRSVFLELLNEWNKPATWKYYST